MQIVQITATLSSGNPRAGAVVYGLGKDNKLYFWSMDQHIWIAC